MDLFSETENNTPKSNIGKVFIINKQHTIIKEIIGDYAILISKLSGEQIVYKITGCVQYAKQFNP